MIDKIGDFLDNPLSCAILGTNGSGKSLLAEEMFQISEISCAIVSLEQQNAVIEEECRNDDADFLDYKDSGRSILDFISVGGEIVPDLEQRFQLFGMDAILSRGLQFLSTGEFRKAQVCRALAEDPRRLVLDELFDGLDAGSQSELSLSSGCS